jgi:hypothetical protein
MTVFQKLTWMQEKCQWGRKENEEPVVSCRLLDMVSQFYAFVALFCFPFSPGVSEPGKSGLRFWEECPLGAGPAVAYCAKEQSLCLAHSTDCYGLSSPLMTVDKWPVPLNLTPLLTALPGADEACDSWVPPFSRMKNILYNLNDHNYKSHPPLEEKLYFCTLFKFNIFHRKVTLLNLSSNAKFLMVFTKAEPPSKLDKTQTSQILIISRTESLRLLARGRLFL